MKTTNQSEKRNQSPLPNLSYRWTQLGTSVVVNFGFAKGKLGEITGFNGLYRWFTQPYGYEKLMPAYEVTFYSEQHSRPVTCTYEEKGLI